MRYGAAASLGQAAADWSRLGLVGLVGENDGGGLVI